MASTIPNSEATQFQSGEDAAIKGHNGGIKSGEVRREKATMKKTLEMLLDSKNKKADKTYRELSTLGLIKGAIDGKAENYKTILALLGELEEQHNETPSVQINIVNNEDLEKVLYENNN